MPRGYKKCPNCHKADIGPRSFNCPSCGYQFDIQKSGVKTVGGRQGRPINWKELQKDDSIKVVSGSGPYWTTKEGEKIPMGYHGIFHIHRIQPDGLLCHPENSKGETCFIYMGVEKKSKVGSMMRPHKIRKIDAKYIRKI